MKVDHKNCFFPDGIMGKKQFSPLFPGLKGQDRKPVGVFVTAPK
jgi:hypothetical protein